MIIEEFFCAFSNFESMRRKLRIQSYLFEQLLRAKILKEQKRLTTWLSFLRFQDLHV